MGGRRDDDYSSVKLVLNESAVKFSLGIYII